MCYIVHQEFLEQEIWIKFIYIEIFTFLSSIFSHFVFSPLLPFELVILPAYLFLLYWFELNP